MSLTYSKLPLFKVYNLLSTNIHPHLWNHYHDQGNEHFPLRFSYVPLPSLPPALPQSWCYPLGSDLVSDSYSLMQLSGQLVVRLSSKKMSSFSWNPYHLFILLSEGFLSDFRSLLETVHLNLCQRTIAPDEVREGKLFKKAICYWRVAVEVKTIAIGVGDWLNSAGTKGRVF